MNQNEMTCKHFFKSCGMNQNNINNKVKYERIIELVSVDMNNIELEHKGKKNENG
tara:strand:+ start:628 stop:792 length:165 start_codon:yes stop_codon:yes gene_type:complete